MLKCHEQPPGRKLNHVPADDDSDWVAHSVARRFGVELHIARLIAHHAGLGGGGDRTTASGGRAK